MLVTAHPDDETMFFAPFIIEAVKQHKVVHLLCLSKGIEPGLTRYEELIKASQVLGIKEVSVYGVHNNDLLPDVPYFQDGFNEDWQKDRVASVVEHFRQKWKIDVIVTFDEGGVSGHPNHKHTCRGVLQHVRYFEGDVSYFVLRSAPLPQKYLSWLGVFLEIMIRRKKSKVFINTNPVAVWKAMIQHKSQLVWHRKIYLLLSTFVYLNILHILFLSRFQHF